jgi:hypothetical protein
LISNIGFGEDATHTVRGNKFHHMETDSIIFPLSHPPSIFRDSLADRYTETHHHGLTFPVNLFFRFKGLFYGM